MVGASRLGLRLGRVYGVQVEFSAVGALSAEKTTPPVRHLSSCYMVISTTDPLQSDSFPSRFSIL